jgi:hypothetical protein
MMAPCYRLALLLQRLSVSDNRRGLAVLVDAT